MTTPFSTTLPSPDDIEMIVCDVDGTLLTTDHVVHPRTLSAFAALRAARPRLPIVIASGKQYSSCDNVRSALQLSDDFPAIHAHGALLHHGNGDLIEARRLDLTALLTIADRMQGRGTFVFRADDTILINDEPGKDWVTIAKKYDKKVEDYSAAAEREAFFERIRRGEEPIVKLTICTETHNSEALISELEKIQRELTTSAKPTFHITRAIPWIIEIVAPEINKRAAVEALCAQRGIDISKVAAFGDGDNDAMMLEAVGHGVAMGNAMPEPRRRANHVTLTNNEGGVGAFLNAVYGFQDYDA